MRVGIAAIINARPNMTVAAQTGSGEEAVALFHEHKPDITLMDLRLPKMSGVDAILAIRALSGFAVRCPDYLETKTSTGHLRREQKAT
jgi:YesN/AraC family two-component response regulator